MVGAVLTQNTSWRNVEKAIANLKSLGLMTAEAIAGADEGALAEALTPSGYYNVKAKRLLSLCRMVLGHGKGGPDPEVLRLPMEELREKLLGVNGVGRETADSIVLYAANLPSFVVDAYTKRILSRHQLMSGDPPYDDVRAWFMGHLESSAQYFNEYHALLVACGHFFCLPKSPRCHLCPLGKDPGLLV
jgi:endonuclease-3 related protein